MSCLNLKLYLNVLMNDRNFFRSSSKMFDNVLLSSEIFSNFRKASQNVGKGSCALRRNLENLQKSSESGGKSLENGQKHRYEFVYIINKIILDFNSISKSAYVISSMYFARSVWPNMVKWSEWNNYWRCKSTFPALTPMGDFLPQSVRGSPAKRIAL